MAVASLSRLLTWLRADPLRRNRKARRTERGPRPSFRPRLETIEARIVPTTLIVMNNADSGAGSLRATIAAANPGDTIKFDNHLHGTTIKLTTGELVIAEALTIQGLGANDLTVSGNNASRVFDITVPAGAAVNISGLTIAHGYAADQGGGILNDAGNLTLSGDDLTQNVVFEGTTSGARGGALRSLDGALTVTGCQITDNGALGGTGAAEFGDAIGGGIYVLAGTATIGESLFSNNLARGGDNSTDASGTAGAFELVPSGTVTDCVFTGNQAVGGNGGIEGFVGDASGGAINMSTSGAGTCIISGSTFDSNRAIGGSNGNSGAGTDDPFLDYGFGGAINAGYFSTLNVTSSLFTNNQAVGGNNATAAGADIVGVGGAEGGAIVNEVGAAASFSGCFFAHNQAIGGNGNSGTGPVVLVGEGLGGAIVSGYGGTLLAPNKLAVSNSIFTQNGAQGGDNNTGTASVAGLVGAGAGAGIANYAGGTASVSGSDLDHNQASGGHHNTAAGTGVVSAGLGAGGAIINYLGNYNSPAADFGPLSPSALTVTGSLIALNQAQGSGSGGNAVGGGIADMLSATTTVSKSILILNQANGGGGNGFGGGAYNDATSSLALSNDLVTLNQANGSQGIGGGVYNLGMFTFDPMTFIVFNHASTSGDNVGP